MSPERRAHLDDLLGLTPDHRDKIEEEEPITVRTGPGCAALPSFAIFTCFAILAIFVVAVAQEKQANICAAHCGEGVSWSFTDRSCTCGVAP